MISGSLMVQTDSFKEVLEASEPPDPDSLLPGLQSRACVGIRIYSSKDRVQTPRPQNMLGRVVVGDVVESCSVEQVHILVSHMVNVPLQKAVV